MTFSIIAIDTDNQMIGSAVASRWTGVGACVPYFRPGVGLVHIQNHSYARLAHSMLDEMESHDNIVVCLNKALEDDTAKQKRQCVIASLKNYEFHAYSGAECNGITHHIIGNNCAAAGNTLATENVIKAMVDSMETNNQLSLAERLINALEAGQAEGGDIRGQEAVSLQVYKFSYPVQRFYPIDLRVDHHETPLKEIRHLYDVFNSNERRIIS